VWGDRIRLIGLLRLLKNLREFNKLMKKSELVFSAVLIPVDYFMVFLAGIFAYHLRFFSFFTDIRPVITEINFQQYITVLFFIPLIFIVIFTVA